MERDAMPMVDFTKDELLDELDGRVRQIVTEIVDSAKTDLRSEMYGMGTDLMGEMQQMKHELRDEMRTMRTDLQGEMEKMRTALDENYRADVNRVSRIDKRLRRHSGQSGASSVIATFVQKTMWLVHCSENQI